VTLRGIKKALKAWGKPQHHQCFFSELQAAQKPKRVEFLSIEIIYGWSKAPMDYSKMLGNLDGLFSTTIRPNSVVCTTELRLWEKTREQRRDRKETEGLLPLVWPKAGRTN
jgi:hypothetical protein